MVDIVDRSRFATAGAMCDIYHIAQSALQQIGEGHRIAGYAQEASTSHTPSSRPPVSSTPSRMQPIRGRGRGRGRGGVEGRVRAGDGGAGHGIDIDSDTCTLDASLTTLLPSRTYPSPSTPQSLPQHIDPSPATPHFVSPHIDPSPSIPLYIDTSPSIPPPDDTIPNPLPEWVRLPGRRPRTRRVHRPLHPPLDSAPSAPSVPSAPSAPPHTAQDPVALQAVYSRRRSKRTIKASSCGTH